MNELYTVNHVAKIFELQPARLRYWIQRGILTPSVRRGGRFLYTFADLIQVKVAAELIRRHKDPELLRRTLISLREQLPSALPEGQLVKISFDSEESGEIIISAAGSGIASDHPLLCAFSTDSLREQIADTPGGLEAVDSAAPRAVISPNDGVTEPHEQPSAYQCFARACDAEEAGDLDMAEIYYERCLALEESFAAARTNLGNLYFRRGKLEAARVAYERALDYEPEQAEARYNLGNLLDDAGETEQAIAELRRVVTRSPEFADAHFNLGVILARVGGFSQARKHFTRYLEFDGSSGWAGRAKQNPRESRVSAGRVSLRKYRSS